MKKRFLPFSLLLVIMILGQSVMADGGHYVPRVKETATAEAFLSSMRVNQHTGLIDPAMMIAASKQSATTSREDAPESLYWISIGPDNLGGRTTSIVYNNQNPKEVYIGSMGGGVFLTKQGISWHQVGKNLMVSCMAQAEDGTIYVGTGDGLNSVNYNGMANLGYANSFIGQGIFTIKDNVMSETPLEGTAPTTLGAVSEWSFVNDIAIAGDYLVAATSDGLRYRALSGGDWSYAKSGSNDLTGKAVMVKVAADQTVVASIDGKIYVGELNAMECRSGESDEVVNDDNVITKIAPAADNGFLDIAVAPSDANVIYAAVIDNAGNHSKIYASFDQGATWEVALPAVNTSYGHNVYGGKGLLNHGLIVSPNNPEQVYVLGKDIWSLSRPENGGYYLAVMMTSTNEIHGMNDLQFDTRDSIAKNGYVATDGGIFKAKLLSSSSISIENCNRGYTTTRCFNVTPTTEIKRVVAGVLDQGPIYLSGEDHTNSLGTAEMLLPQLSPAYYGLYSESYTSGSSLVSAICPNTMIITTKDGGITRSETGCVDFDDAYFTENQSFSFTGYRMPIAMYESFYDENSAEGFWFKCTQNMEAGTVLRFASVNGGYPYEFVLPEDMHFNESDPEESDSLWVRDPVTAKLFAPSVSGNDHNIYITFDALRFDKASDWYQIGTVTGYPTCMTISTDGDVLYVGTREGKLYRFSNMNDVVDGNTATYNSEDYAAEMKEIEIGDQCITSVAILNDDNDKVVVTMGNYGNNAYVFYCDNAIDDNPTFVSKQGNMPKMPVYSSVYTEYIPVDDSLNVTGAIEEHVLLGTEHGVYRTTNIDAASPEWVAETAMMGDVPVLDMKQQNMSHPSVNNRGMIYAATFGRGLFRCENYRKPYSGVGVPEATVTTAKSNVNMYPNPVRDAAKVSFELNDNASVSYQVYDFSGRMVKSERMGNFGQGKHEINISVDDLAKGAYLLRLNAGNQSSSVKFMVF